MMLKSELEAVFLSQQAHWNKHKHEIERTYLEKITRQSTHIQVISGIRRCGKSTLLKHVMQSLSGEIAYFNFEDVRLVHFETEDFQILDRVMEAEKYEAYFFDEIQNIPKWEIYIRQLHDRGELVYITGSNASLLSKELGTRLTGRHIRHELFPFSYQEFLQFKNLIANAHSLDEYIHKGGFPEFLSSENIEILQTLVKDIVLRDIAIRHGVRNTKVLLDIALFLISNTSKPYSYNSIKKMFDLGSVNSISDYLSWLEDCYLLFFVSKFSWSPKSRNINPRKVYAIDTGLIQNNTLSFSKDSGRMLENTVYLFLRQKNLDIYYFKEKKECDFVLFEKNTCVQCIQVCEEVHRENKERELNGLLEALHFFNMPQGYIITKNQEDELIIEGKKIKMIPAYLFLID